MKEEKTREYFRLTYPENHRPVLSLGIDQYQVEDISEHGIKIIIEPDDPTFEIDDEVMGILIFPEGREFDISGRVMRILDGSVGVELDTPLPDTLIRSEALHVLYNLPQDE